MQTKHSPALIKAMPDSDGTFEGYASVFGVVDQGLDVVAPGAFRASLSTGRKVKMLWQHDTSKVIGVYESIAEDDYGLKVKGRLLADVKQGAEALILLRAGAIDSMSIGYRVREAEADGRVRRLTAIDLMEISLVTFPMLPDALVTAVKGIETERQFERFLRDAGYSKADATAITSLGFKGYLSRRDAAADDGKAEDAARADLAKLLQSFGKAFQ
jgi:hypothetical protein